MEECQSIKCLNLQRQSQAGPIRVEMINLFISSLIGKRHDLKPWEALAMVFLNVDCLISRGVPSFVHLSIKVVWMNRINYWQCNELQLQLFQAFSFQYGLITWSQRSSARFFTKWKFTFFIAWNFSTVLLFTFNYADIRKFTFDLTFRYLEYLFYIRAETSLLYIFKPF